VYDEELEKCVFGYTTEKLCPPYHVYNAEDFTCTKITDYPADCLCAADVIATPQTLCNGGTTSIALTSTIPGVTYQWIVAQTGVTGASSGSGSTIAQTLNTTTGGTALYTITPYESGGCVGQSKQVLVTVNVIPDIIATPNTPQTIESGESTSIVLSSGVAGTTFAWTVTAPSTMTGATAGSGTTIVNTLTASVAGAAVYHIVATAPNGCTNTLEYTVNVGATVTACLATLTAKVFYDNLEEYRTPTSKAMVRLTGTSGTGNFIVEGNSYSVVYNSSGLTQTVSDFYTAHSAAFTTLGLVLQKSEEYLFFTKYSATPIVVTFTNLTGTLSSTTPSLSNYNTISSNILSSETVVNLLYDSASSTSGHGCCRARYEFMTNGLPVGIVNLNNSQGTILPQQENGTEAMTNPTIGQPGYPETYPGSSRQSIVEYELNEIASIVEGLPSGVDTLKIRLRGTNTVPVAGFPEPLYYDQHSSVSGLQFFVNGISVYKGVIGNKILVVDPCNPSATPEILSETTGGKSIINSITWGSGTGTLAVGVPITTPVTQTATVNVTSLGSGTNIGSYDFIAYANGVTFRAIGNFTTLGSNTVVLTALGTPTIAGTTSFQPDLSIPVNSEISKIPPSFSRIIT
jgi:hypothetical protein